MLEITADGLTVIASALQHFLCARIKRLRAHASRANEVRAGWDILQTVAAVGIGFGKARK
jgi:hypothetical protein